MRIELYNDGIGFVSLIDSMGDDLRACHSARVSFLRDDLEKQGLTERDVRLIQFLLREGHTSPFEHSVITFKMKVPLFIRAQIMRHRTFSYNEVSRRYTSDEIEFYVPTALRQQSTKNLQCSEGWLSDGMNAVCIDKMKSHFDASFALYQSLLANGVAREQARIVLPQSMYTTFWMTGNLHNWIKFLRLRNTEHAQLEVRHLAIAIQEILWNLYPATLRALEGDDVAEILAELESDES